jgi:hypothetical protein
MLIGAKVESSQIPNEGSCHNFFPAFLQNPAWGEARFQIAGPRDVCDGRWSGVGD